MEHTFRPRISFTAPVLYIPPRDICSIPLCVRGNFSSHVNPQPVLPFPSNAFFRRRKKLLWMMTIKAEEQRAAAAREEWTKAQGLAMVRGDTATWLEAAGARALASQELAR